MFKMSVYPSQLVPNTLTYKYAQIELQSHFVSWFEIGHFGSSIYLPLMDMKSLQFKLNMKLVQLVKLFPIHIGTIETFVVVIRNNTCT